LLSGQGSKKAVVKKSLFSQAFKIWSGKRDSNSRHSRWQPTINVSFIGKVKTFVQIFAILFLLYQQPFFGLPSFEIGVFLLFSK
jgi:CDP-diacylglycerol--glycerol-3-phosphate 3-phosphatidyltransferase